MNLDTPIKQEDSSTFKGCSRKFSTSTPVTFIGEYPPRGICYIKTIFLCHRRCLEKLAWARMASLYFAFLFRVQRADRCWKSTKHAVLNLVENWEINRGPHSKGLIRSMVDLISEEYMEYKRVWPLNRISFSGDPRRYQFYALAGPVNTAATQILKIELHNYGHNIPRRFTQADKSNNKAHTLMVYLPRFLFFPDLSGSNDYGVPFKFAHATRLTLAR